VRQVNRLTAEERELLLSILIRIEARISYLESDEEGQSLDIGTKKAIKELEELWK